MVRLLAPFVEVSGRGWCYSGIAIYVMLSFILFFGLTSPESSAGESVIGVILVIGLFAVVLLFWYFMLVLLAIPAAVAIIIYGLSCLLGLCIDLFRVFSAVVTISVVLVIAYHLWLNARHLRSVSKSTRGILKAFLAVSCASYYALAYFAIISLVVPLADLIPATTWASVEVGDLEMDIGAAIIGALIAVGNAGLGGVLLTGEGKAVRAAGILHLIGSSTLLVITYYLLGPVLHLPYAPGQPIAIENILTYPLPATALAVFTLAGLAAWSIVTPSCT